MSTVRGYDEYTGDLMSTVGVFSTPGGIMSTLGTYHDKCGEIS